MVVDMQLDIGYSGGVCIIDRCDLTMVQNYLDLTDNYLDMI